jgi:hypothetical protein
MESPGEVKIDAAVGGLVWVRRRNGSWWPGRILGADELPDTSLISPRSGTPVKLLGRDDASIDWYNLEKSKRVKPFRCGEYDKCIEKAQAAAANSSKKAVKYARREDAIIQALELESARQIKESPESNEPSSDNDGDEEQIKEEDQHDLIASDDNSNSGQELSQSGVSFEDPNHISSVAIKELSVRQRTPNDSEDDGSEGIKRMKGLEDLGMGVVSSFKRKRSQVAHVHDFLRKKNRRRQLTKVLESTAMVTVPVMCESKSICIGVNNNNSDSTCENVNASEHATTLVTSQHKENEISSMELDLPVNEASDVLFDVPFLPEENRPTEPCVASKKTRGGQSSQSSQVETELNESASTSSGAAAADADAHVNVIIKNDNDNNIVIEKETSKWQSKGKRNSRQNAPKNRKIRSTNDISACFAGGGSYPISEHQADKFQGWTRRSSPPPPPPIEEAPQRSMPYRQSRFTVHPKYRMSDLSVKDCSTDSALYEVHLEVKVSQRPQGVPYISLMSKFNCRPITGHPITVEVLDVSVCDLLLKNIRRSECNSSSFELRNKTVVKKKKSNSKEVRGKQSKSKKNGILSKKIRKLSSLTGANNKLSEEDEEYEDKKLVILEKLKGPSVACVPLKIVFSRINAALNSSMRPVLNHRLMEEVEE